MASAEAQLTPMMAQYRRIKGELPKDALLLFRLGDFYEMFFEDAQTGAQLLNLALTARNGVPMCGLPHHASGTYIGRLLKAGRKVAICDQFEDARPGKLVKREVTQILSPGTHFDERMLSAERNNFLAAVCPRGKITGLALVDLTTGDFLATELESQAALLAELERLRPAEIIYPGEAAAVRDLLRDSFKILSGHDDWAFAPETAIFTLREHFKVASLDGFGLKERDRGHRRGRRRAALLDAASAAGREEPHADFVLPAQRFSDAGRHDAAASGNSGAAAPRRAAQRLALRRGQPHGDADGRAAAAPLAVAAARRDGADPPAAGGGADVHRKFRHVGRISRAIGEGARSGADGRPVELGQRQCARPGRLATGAGTNSHAETNAFVGRAGRPSRHC